MITLYTETYGEGEFLGYDPRFPGYFSAKFNIKGKDIIINNLTKRDLTRITETLEVECLEDDAQMSISIEKDGSFEHTVCSNIKGEKVKISHMRLFLTNPNMEFWDIHYNHGTIDGENPMIQMTKIPPIKYNVKSFMNFEFSY